MLLGVSFLPNVEKNESSKLNMKTILITKSCKYFNKIYVLMYKSKLREVTPRGFMT